MNWVTTRVDKAQQARGDHSKPVPRLTVADIGGQQHRQVGPDELVPRDGFFAFRCRWDAMAFEDIANGLITKSFVTMASSPKRQLKFCLQY
jgi:hypothetical protein